MKNVRIEHNFPGIGHRTLWLNAHRISDDAGTTQLILLAIEDITPQGSAEEVNKTANRDRKKG